MKAANAVRQDEGGWVRAALAGWLAFLLVAAGCQSTSAPSEAPEDAPQAAVQVELAKSFTLAPGESAKLGDAGPYITFREVSSDSRCPADVVCVWMGDAVVALEVGSPWGWLRGDLHTDPQQPPLTFGDYRIELAELQPYPLSSEPIRADRYRATLRVTKP